MKPKILVITPVQHISGVVSTLENFGDVHYIDDPSPSEVMAIIGEYEAVFTNPNKSNVFISKELIDAGLKLKAICTASTGTNHIDMAYAASQNLPVISITEAREVINKISSTSELAFTLMMASLRKLIPAWESVKAGEWDYVPYIGRQLDFLTIGIIGYGRLGSIFADYCLAFKSRVLAHDPYKHISHPMIEQVPIDELLTQSDVISLHVHVTPETTGMLDKTWLSKCKKDVVIINTSRGDVCNEQHLIGFLESNPEAQYATDVLANETTNKSVSELRAWALTHNQVLITPHIGGMTSEAQEIAYNHAAKLLDDFFARSRA